MSIFGAPRRRAARAAHRQHCRQAALLAEDDQAGLERRLDGDIEPTTKLVVIDARRTQSVVGRGSPDDFRIGIEQVVDATPQLVALVECPSTEQIELIVRLDAEHGIRGAWRRIQPWQMLPTQPHGCRPVGVTKRREQLNLDKLVMGRQAQIPCRQFIDVVVLRSVSGGSPARRIPQWAWCGHFRRGRG